MKLTGLRNIANADIIFLTDNAKLGEEVVNKLEVKKVHTLSTFSGPYSERKREKMAFFKGDARIKATTLHSYKGWESRIILLHISSAITHENLSLIYSGLTRIRRSAEGSWMTVVCDADILDSYGRLWPDYVKIE
jgi:hypothetical protein